VQHLCDVVRQRAQRWPTAVALGAPDGLGGGRALDSRAFLAQVDGLAEQVTGRGVRWGDRVVLSNCSTRVRPEL
jgi:non-ribosomal peptide synthetase component E (peptide arylation enzyme)